MIKENYKRQYGFGLLELIITLTISAMMVVMYMRMQSDSQAQIRASIASNKLQEITVAGQAYMSANTSALLTATTGGNLVEIPVARTSANDAIPAGPNANLPSLQGGGFIPEAFLDQNSYGQTHKLLIQLDGVGNLIGLITEIGGTAIPDQNLGQIINKLGSGGGAVFTRSNTTLIQGAGGGYQYDITAWDGIPQPGHAVSMINLSVPAMAQYLYRDNIGVPQLNTMNTAIDMGGNGTHNNITNAGTVTMDSLNAQNGGFACASQTAGCSFWIGKDGYLTDMNDGWTKLVGTSPTGGFMISGPAGGGNLQVSGGQTVAGTFQAYADAIIGGNLNVGGKLGIGTQTPAGTLDVENGTNDAKIVQNGVTLGIAQNGSYFNGYSTAVQAIAGDEGFTNLPGGMIMQWGGAQYYSSYGDSGVYQAFPKPFPHACFQFVAMDCGGGANSLGGNCDQGGVSLIGRAGNIHSDTCIRYIALGN